jgi:hypothetical protein
LESKGFEISFLDSPFHAKNLNIFEDPHEFTSHFKKVIDYACKAKASYILFSDPTCRLIATQANTFTLDRVRLTQHALFINIMKAIAVHACTKNVTICIGNANNKLKSNYLILYQEVVDVVGKIANKNITASLDVKSSLFSSEDIHDIQHVCNQTVIYMGDGLDEQIEYLRINRTKFSTLLLKGTVDSPSALLNSLLEIMSRL